jgi:hypothetical protein
MAVNQRNKDVSSLRLEPSARPVSKTKERAEQLT